MTPRELLAVYLRSLLFGIEDSLVSTVGLLSGIAIAGVSRIDIIFTGLVLLVVEGFSMAAGEFLSERSVEEYTGHGRLSIRYAIFAGIIMFFSYFIAGLIPLSPYTFLETNATTVSIILSLTALFALGAMSARRFKVNWLSHGLRMLLIGGSAIFIGIVVGGLVR